MSPFNVTLLTTWLYPRNAMCHKLPPVQAMKCFLAGMGKSENGYDSRMDMYITKPKQSNRSRRSVVSLLASRLRKPHSAERKISGIPCSAISTSCPLHRFSFVRFVLAVDKRSRMFIIHSRSAALEKLTKYIRAVTGFSIC